MLLFVVCISMCCVYVNAYMHLDNMMCICVHIDMWFICLCISMCGVYLIASRNCAVWFLCNVNVCVWYISVCVFL